MNTLDQINNPPPSRRRFLRDGLLLAAAAPGVLLLSARNARAAFGAPASSSGGNNTAATTPAPFTLPRLPYAFDALEPHIDARTMQIHHDRHHAAYVTNLNNAVKDRPELAGKSAEELIRNLDAVPEAVRTAVRNNGGGHVNHTMFWNLMSPRGGGPPRGEIATVINRDFGGFDAFRTAFNDAGLRRFGSGWVWLVRTRDNKMEITTTPYQDNPLMEGHYPILGNDVWEHAYYLRYQNRRADYLKAWWNTVNWDAVNSRLATATAAR
jgi:Fe-Mn family superoxide dismutase